MAQQPLWVDARRLAAMFRGLHMLTPSVVMQLLHTYFEQGPFQLDPMRLRDRMNAEHLGLRVNTLGLVGLEEELRQFFEVDAEGCWRPRGELFQPKP